MSAADRAANLWLDAAEFLDQPTTAYNVFRRCLRKSLGDEAEIAIAYRDDQAVVVAIEDERLLVAKPLDPDARGGEVQIEIDSISLGAPRRVTLTFAQRRVAARDLVVRRWRLGEVGLGAIELETRPSFSRFSGEENSAEELLEAVSERLGWRLPKPN